ncbi:iron chelate uptake ABC transporter family permease subunit [Streptomyces sp. SID5910]|uniref:iron chelate uptake ABC transporter family permease subunit n=1 Tax=Streptomyces sp. SID5910 TaxID=2690312 RepID=UPI0031F89013
MAVIVLDAGAAQSAVCAVRGGVATGAAVHLLARKRGMHGYRLVLVGICASSVLGAATSFLYLRADIGKAAQAVAWTIGSLNARGRHEVRVVAMGLAVLAPVVLAYERRLTLWEMGDDTAAALGVPPERSRLVLLGEDRARTVPFVAPTRSRPAG